MRLYEKLNPGQTDSRKKNLIVPRFINLMQKCVEHQIQDCFIRSVHFTDLYVLVLKIDIENIKHALKKRKKERAKKSNVEIRDISQASAVQFLKGGGASVK